MSEFGHEKTPSIGVSPSLAIMNFTFNTRAALVERAVSRRLTSQPATRAPGTSKYFQQPPRERLTRGISRAGRTIGTAILNTLRSSMSDYGHIYDLHFGSGTTQPNANLSSKNPERKVRTLDAQSQISANMLVNAAAEEIIIQTLATLAPQTRDTSHSSSSLDHAPIIIQAEGLVREHAESTLPRVLVDLILSTPRKDDYVIQPETAVWRLARHLRDNGMLLGGPAEPFAN